MDTNLTRSQFTRGLCAAFVWGASLAAEYARAAAPAVSQFYKGRTVTLIIPTTTGGINDLAGRLVARHLGRFIPGNPAIRPENREEGGGLALANRFADAPEKDGATIAVIQRGIPQLAIQGDPNAK